MKNITGNKPLAMRQEAIDFSGMLWAETWEQEGSTLGNSIRR
jgi:hypothetical protein